MTPAEVILIAPAAALPGLTAQVAHLGPVRAFADTDALVALDATFTTLPGHLVLERRFAESLRGQALLRRVTADPFGRECLIRLIEVDETAETRSAAEPAAAPPAEAPATAPRTTPRHAVAAGTTVQLDGTAVTLVDLSVDGMQVMGPLTLRPNQTVRLTLPDGLRVRARVAWATMELGGATAGPRYRAGLALVDADRPVIEALIQRLSTGA